jgi:FlaA1/EpsC-like NDP-sugar epimerase
MAGHTLDEIHIVFSGLRPGEKLFEELLADSDATLATPFERLRVAQLDAQGPSVDGLMALANSGVAVDDAGVRAALACAIPEYRKPGEPA